MRPGHDSISTQGKAKAYSQYLADPADVLVARLLIESEILVEAEADVIAVEAVGELLEVEEVLLERTSDGRLQQGSEV